MKKTEKQINKSQLFCLLIIVGLASAVLTLPSVLAAEAGRDLWLSVLISFAVYLAVFALFVKIYKLNPDTDLYTVIKKSLGDIGAKMIYALFFLYFAWKALMLLAETEGFCTSRLYGNLPWYFYALVLCGLAVFMAARELKATARCGQLSLVFILAAIFVCVGAAAGQMNFEKLLPVTENGFAPVFKGFYKTAVWFGDFLVLFMMLGKIRPDDKLPRTFYAGYGVTAVMATAFCAAYYALYGGLSGFRGHGEAFANITNFSRESSMGLISGIFNQFWLLACFIKLAVLFWAANEALIKITGIKKPIYTALPLAALLYVLDVFVIENIDAAFYISIKYVNYLAAACYALPILILVCAIKHRKTAEKFPFVPSLASLPQADGAGKKENEQKQ